MKTVAVKRPAKVPAKAPSAKTAVAKAAVRNIGAKAAPVHKSVPDTKKKAASAPVKAKPAVAKNAAPKAAAVKPVVAPKAPVPKTAAKNPAAVSSKKAASIVATPAVAVLPPVPPKILPMPIVASRPPPLAVKKDPKLANNWKAKPIEQWTDAEVIAMPDGEYMNDKQLAFFRLKLVELKDGILANAGQTAENLRDDTVVVPDPADRATIEEEHALELRTRDRERKLLKKIEQSIARIDAGDYGYCDETGEPIGVPRLLARPTATLSLEAQQRREMKQKMFGD